MHFLIKSIQLQILLIFLMLASTTSFSQTPYDDYLGAGHNIGVKVRTSSNSLSSVGENTINGAGLDAKKIEASRFLFQAAFGGDIEEINSLSKTLNFEEWIENQFNQPMTLLHPKLWEVDARSRVLFEAENPGEEYFGPYSVHFQFAWWDNNFKAPDQLRQRIAFALSQIAVISSNSQIGDYGEGLASYYDILIRNALGNYEDVLQEITIDPNMGFYLSHLNNPKSDELGTKPDENYAREIMQLFSIGLYELHNDGSRKLDSNGDWIPTYDNRDIQELAKVFTGLKGGAWSREVSEYYTSDMPVEFHSDIYSVSREVPLQMEEDQHEPGEKTIIGNYRIPAGQTGMEDIRQAVKHIFNHPNVGPFIGKRLIQQFVKSNPSRPYVSRVADAFNDNGSGVRGDMKAVIKAVLLDPEARECAAMHDPKHGKLREPLLRYTQIMHSIPSDSPDGYYWNNGYDYLDDTGQLVLGAPSVFNFYQPNYQPDKDFIDQGIVGPEYQVHNSQSAIGYMNQAHKWTDWGILFWDWYDSTPNTDVALNDYFDMAEDPETLINHLDVLMVHGRLSAETKQIIKNAMHQIPTSWDDHLSRRVQICLYLIMISPDYVVLK